MSLPEATTDAENFRVDILSHDAGPIIALAGEFDISGLAQFERAVERVDAAGAAEIVLDFTELQFIDSTGIASIVGAMARSEAAGRRQPACGIRGQVQQIFDLVGILERFEPVPRPQSATPWPLDT
jgi:anti-sigma B factor antagonist